MIRWKDILPDVCAFIGVAILLITQHWRVQDLIWSLWLSSLCVGYASILAMLTGAWRLNQHRSSTARPIVGALMFGFFTLHFGLFHFGQGTFIAHFYPLTDLDRDSAFIIPFTEVIRQYWPFVAFTFISRFADLRRYASVEGTREDLQRLDAWIQRRIARQMPDARDRPPLAETGFSGMMPVNPVAVVRPYVDVMRMHIMIMLMVVLNLVQAETYVLYVVLVLYFVPWGRLRRARREQAK